MGNQTRIRSFLATVSEGYTTLAVVLLGTLILLCVLEVALAPFRTINRDLREKRFVVENWPSLSKAYPNFSQAEVISLVSEARGSMVRLAYAPWIQFGSPPIKAAYVNSNGVRRRGSTSTDWESAIPDGRHFDVYFFGGSTMFGFGVPDGETLPAQFEKMAPRAWNARAFNYGVPSYYSRQETLLFEMLLRNGEIPKAAVFLDGLNDVLQPTASYRREPFFTPLMRRRMEISVDLASLALDSNIMRALHTVGLVPSTSSLTHGYYDPPAGVSIEMAANRILENYFENMRFTQLLCEAYHVECFFVWQPSPMFEYHRDEDSLSRKTPTPLSKIIYEKISALKVHPPGFIDLSRSLDGFEGQPFVDEFHYSSPFMAVLAKRLLHCVSPVRAAPSSDKNAATTQCK
ncbi:MAG: hypothetical protein OEL86_05800 [Sulfuritalea sp.]|nr:hypothetical protein [Sulfuritalea sp.]